MAALDHSSTVRREALLFLAPDQAPIVPSPSIALCLSYLSLSMGRTHRILGCSRLQSSRRLLAQFEKCVWKPSHPKRRSLSSRTMHRPTVASAVLAGMEVPAYAVYRGAPGVNACPRTEKRDRTPTRATDGEVVAVVGTTFARIHDKPCPTRTTNSRPLSAAHGDAHGAGTVVRRVRFPGHRVHARAVVVSARARRRGQTDRLRARARGRERAHRVRADRRIGRGNRRVRRPVVAQRRRSRPAGARVANCRPQRERRPRIQTGVAHRRRPDHQIRNIAGHNIGDYLSGFGRTLSGFSCSRVSSTLGGFGSCQCVSSTLGGFCSCQCVSSTLGGFCRSRDGRSLVCIGRCLCYSSTLGGFCRGGCSLCRRRFGGSALVGWCRIGDGLSLGGGGFGLGSVVECHQCLEVGFVCTDNGVSLGGFGRCLCGFGRCLCGFGRYGFGCTPIGFRGRRCGGRTSGRFHRRGHCRCSLCRCQSVVTAPACNSVS